MKAGVLEALEAIEAEHDVRVLFAVESGSGAWGFASPDSDYDVRFVYVHALDWYLSIVEPRDVIERMLPEDLDVSGWELRKTLRLFLKCNLALNEWLGSPIVYREEPEFRQQLAALVPLYFNARVGVHHYRSMAERAFAENYVDGRIRIKKIFYVLRALLACRWIEQSASQPPTEFARLVAAEWVSTEERGWIEGLLDRKKLAAEADAVALETARAEAIRSELQRYELASAEVPPPAKGRHEALDAMLRAWIGRFSFRDGLPTLSVGPSS